MLNDALLIYGRESTEVVRGSPVIKSPGVRAVRSFGFVNSAVIVLELRTASIFTTTVFLRNLMTYHIPTNQFSDD